MSHVNAMRLTDDSDNCFDELQQVQLVGITFGREGVLLGRCLSVCLLYPLPVELLFRHRPPLLFNTCHVTLR